MSALWALIIERINRMRWGEFENQRDPPDILATQIAASHERASLLFCLLRDAPVLLEHSSRKRFQSTGKAMVEIQLGYCQETAHRGASVRFHMSRSVRS
jgi:hypothetical protein